MRRKERQPGPEHIQPIKRLFIANRGEIAVRAAIACKKRGIQAVIPYSDLESERESLATRIADRNMKTGWDLAHLEGVSADQTYGNPQAILDSAKANGCDAIFLGYGFLAENAVFVAMCEREKIRVLAPPSDAMRLTGDKAKAGELTRKTKIPVLEGSPLRESLAELAKDVSVLGYPVMIKDPDLGGGQGNVVAHNPMELASAYGQLRFGENRGLFAERLIEDAVHVEMQIVADQYGNVVCLGERDCTIQRQYQKIVEESPSPNITDRMREGMQEAAIKIAKEASYSGVGTVEFIVDLNSHTRKGGKNKRWYFMEVNPRLQVEHTVTEEQTGLDIVDLMIDIAEGKPLPFTQNDIKPKGHSMEVRVYAEDPNRNFEPQEGILHVFDLPEMEGIRIDRGYEQGDQVSTQYDSTLCKIIAHGQSREEAISRLTQALSVSQIAGVKTNTELLAQLINTPEFRQGQVTTHFVQEWLAKKRKEVQNGSTGITELLGENGIFKQYSPTRSLDETVFPVNPTLITSNSARPMSRSEYMQQQREKTGKELGSEYGIIERDGIQFVVYALNPNFNRGTFGKEEGWMLENASKLAHEKNLPLITVSSTAGIRNTENTQALQMMAKSVVDISLTYPPLFHIDVRHGFVFGGVPASYGGIADIFIAVQDAKIGLTGPNAVASIEGVIPKDKNDQPSSKATDAYKALDAAFGTGTTHTPVRHHDKRTGADILVNDLAEAGDKITHILHMLKSKHPQLTTNGMPHVFSPREQIGYRPMSDPLATYDSPTHRIPGWLVTKTGISNLLERISSRSHREEKTVFTQELSIGERRRIIKHPDRPTALDLIDPASKLFDDAVMLDSIIHVGGVIQTVPIISALALYGEHPLLVIAQQSQQRIIKDGGTETYYEPIRPADWRAMRRNLKLAAKLGITVIELGNTSGAAAGREAEDQGQTTEIAQTIREVVNHPTPQVSINIGLKGSGGGVPFIWKADYSAAFSNSIALAADLPAMRSFIEGGPLIDETHATQEELARLDLFAEQFTDATAQGQLADKQIDRILQEGPGGAHEDPQIVIAQLRTMLGEILPELKTNYLNNTLLQERKRRLQEVSNVGSRKFEEI